MVTFTKKNMVALFTLLLAALFIPSIKADAAENLAYKKSVTATSTESGSYPAANAVDANGNTRWSSSYADNQNFVVDLGSNYTVSSVKIAWEAAYASQYQIQVSTDRNTWTTVYENYNAKGGTQTINFSARSARYVKVYCIKRATSYGFSFYEMEVYGSDSGNSGSSNSGSSNSGSTSGGSTSSSENVAYGKKVTVSSTESSSYAGSNAVDANGNTRWSSSYADNQNLIVDLGSNYSLSSFKIAWEAAYASQYQIQVSTNNSTWTTVYENYNATGGTQTISISPTTARYVKVYCIKRATSYGFSIFEFEAYTGSAPSSGSSGSGSSGSGSSGSGGSSSAAASKQKVLNYLYSIKGKQTVIGIHNREPNSDPAKQTNQAHAITGQYAGLWSGDFLFSSSDVNNRWNMIYECERQWNSGSIVQLMLHVTNPTQGESGNWDGGVCSKLSDSQWNSLITNGGDLNKKWKARLDTYATYLQYLKGKGVPVLFRPFHEMNQAQFWWAGRTGSNGTAALFRLTRDYLEKEKGLDNLIWVWDMQDLSYNWSDYNPGNNYWDIFAVDVYNADYFTSYKYNLANQIAGSKLMAIGECDKLPTSAELRAQPNWCFVMSWAELTFSKNNNTQIQNLYWADNVIIRSELPSFK
ncbi:MAG: discoidin domain-containing protein [Lachnospiraceae bacterium]|nr:discoidin domain-containing protein [Lachnospiraceae bacterium]